MVADLSLWRQLRFRNIATGSGVMTGISGNIGAVEGLTAFVIFSPHGRE